MLNLTDNHAPRLLKMAPLRVEALIRDEVEAGAQLIVDEAVFSIIDGAVSGSGHVPSLPGEAPSADTHDLDQSIHTGDVIETPGSIRSSAIADSDHAVFLEKGTSRMAERPYMAPASRRSRGKIIRSLVDRLRKGRA